MPSTHINFHIILPWGQSLIASWMIPVLLFTALPPRLTEAINYGGEKCIPVFSQIVLTCVRICWYPSKVFPRLFATWGATGGDCSWLKLVLFTQGHSALSGDGTFIEPNSFSVQPPVWESSKHFPPVERRAPLKESSSSALSAMGSTSAWKF